MQQVKVTVITSNIYARWHHYLHRQLNWPLNYWAQWAGLSTYRV